MHLHVRHITPSDFATIHAFDCHPLPRLRDGELRLFTQWCGAVSFILETPAADIAGFALAMASADEHTVFLHYLVVAASWRGHGWGDRLLATVEAAAGERGAAQVALWTVRAGAYYTARGYAATSELVPDDHGPYTVAQRGGQFLTKRLVASLTPQEARPW